MRRLVALPLALALAWAAVPRGAAARILPGAVAEAGAAAESPAGCHSRIEGFRQAVTFYRGPNRVLLEAQEACAPRRGAIYDLSRVRLRVFSGGRALMELRSDRGAWAPAQHRLLLMGAERASGNGGCLSGAEALTLDLRTGELRAPGYRAVLNGPRPLSCGKAAGG